MIIHGYRIHEEPSYISHLTFHLCLWLSDSLPSTRLKLTPNYLGDSTTNTKARHTCPLPVALELSKMMACPKNQPTDGKIIIINWSIYFSIAASPILCAIFVFIDVRSYVFPKIKNNKLSSRGIVCDGSFFLQFSFSRTINNNKELSNLSLYLLFSIQCILGLRGGTP